MQGLHTCRSALSLAAAVLLAGSAYAQESLSPGLSPGLSGSLSDSTATSGFNTSFDASTASLTNPDLRTDVSDDTHSQLLGSAISPLDNSYANFAAQTAPMTSTLTNSQSVTGFGNFSFGGRHSQSFASTGTAGTLEAAAARRSSLAGFGTQAGFATTAGGRAAFSGQTSSLDAGTHVGFSGEGVAIPKTVSGAGPAQTLVSSGASTGGADLASGYNAVDPVLSGDKQEADLELAGDMGSPSTQTGAFFAEAEPVERQFQFDDGQTPPSRIAAHPGSILGVAPEYAPNPSGFPDSTRGLAGLAQETSNSASPFAPAGKPGNSPFAPVSEGTVFGLSTPLNPSLHNLSGRPATGSFEAVEHRAQEQRLTHGVSISDSFNAYQQDRRDYHQSVGRRRSPTLQELENTNRQGSSHATIKEPVIR